MGLSTTSSNIVIRENYFDKFVKEEEKKDKPAKVEEKSNLINFTSILYARENNDRDILKQTTLMIKNIPIRISQQIMIDLVDKKFKG